MANRILVWALAFASALFFLDGDRQTGALILIAAAILNRREVKDA